MVDEATGTSLYILPGSLSQKDGTVFEGIASVSLTVVDVAKDADISCMPGHFRGKALDGIEAQLASLGAAHVAATDAATGQDLIVTPEKGLTLTMPSAAPIDISIIDEAPSLWYFDEASGLWVQEGSVSICADGQELPPPGHKLGETVSAGGALRRAFARTHHQSDHDVDAFWRSEEAVFRWAVGGTTGVGNDFGSGSNGTSCVWLALARMCTLEGTQIVCADALLAEAQELATKMLPFTQGKTRATLQDVLDAGPVSLEVLQLLQLPTLSTVALRALEVRGGRVRRVHCIDGARALKTSAKSCLLLEAAEDGSAHTTVLSLPASLHDTHSFADFAQGLLPKDSMSVVSLRCGGKKAGRKKGSSSSSRPMAESLEGLEGFSKKLEGFSKKKLAEILKDRRKLVVTLLRLGWSNIDFPLPRLVQISGKLVSSEGRPTAGAQIVAKGLNHMGWSYASTQLNGSFSFLVSAGAQFVLEASMCGQWFGSEWVSRGSSSVAWAKLSDVLQASNVVGDCSDFGDLTPAFVSPVEAMIRKHIHPAAKDASMEEKTSCVIDAFNRFDLDRDGKISRQDLRLSVISQGSRVTDADKMFAEIDTDHTGAISLENLVEFAFADCQA